MLSGAMPTRTAHAVAAEGELRSTGIETSPAFGQRAGPLLADQIQGGNFAIQDLVAQVAASGDTVNQAAADTAMASLTARVQAGDQHPTKQHLGGPHGGQHLGGPHGGQHLDNWNAGAPGQPHPSHRGVQA